jgi:hypothetical protein
MSCNSHFLPFDSAQGKLFDITICLCDKQLQLISEKLKPKKVPMPAQLLPKNSPT